MLSIFKKKYSDEELNTFEFLRKVSLFWNLTNEELELFVPIMFLRNYKQNEVVFFSGDPSQALYIVRKGRVALTVDVNDKFEELTKLYQGSAFGDNALLDNQERIYNSVVTSEKAELFVIPRINATEILDNHPEIKAKVMVNMATLYNGYTQNLFKVYKSSFGFFELRKVYKGHV